MNRYFCTLCKKTFALSVELRIHQRTFHKEIEEDNRSKNVKNLISNQPRSSNSCMNNDITESMDVFPIKSEELIPSTSEWPGQEKLKFKLTSGVKPAVNFVVIKTEPVESEKVSGGKKCLSPQNTLSVGQQFWDNQSIVTNTAACSKDTQFACESDELITGDIPENLPRKTRPKSTPTKTKSNGQLSLTRRRGCPRPDISNEDECSCNCEAGAKLDNLITCLTCNKFMKNHIRLVLHERKYHPTVAARVHAASKLKCVHGASVSSNLISYQKPSILKRWPCKKCGKLFERYSNLWKHRLHTCDLVYKKNYATKPLVAPKALIHQKSLAKHNEEHRLRAERNERFRPENMEILKVSGDVSLRMCRSENCNRLFNDRAQLISHAQECHNIFMCSLCTSVLMSSADLQTHFQKRHRDYEGSSFGGLPSSSKQVNLRTNEESKEYSADLFEGGAKSNPKVLIKQLNSKISRMSRRSDKTSSLSGMNPKVNPAGSGQNENTISPGVSSTPRRAGSSSSVSSYTCGNCGRKFNTNRLFLYHLQNGVCNKKVYGYECEYCHERFSREATLKNHIKCNHETRSSEDEPEDDASEKFQCKVCGKVVATARGLKTHMQTKHSLGKMSSQLTRSLSIEKPCDNSRRFEKELGDVSRSPNKGRYSRKRSSSRNPFPTKSPKVARVVPFPEAYPQHKGHLHRSQQVFQSETLPKSKCNECGDMFDSMDELAQHLLHHNEAKSDPIAPKIFRGLRKTGVSLREVGLEAHIRCVICGGLFKSHSDMIQHVYAKHSRKGKYGCMECKEVFTMAMQLVLHSQNHKKLPSRAEKKPKIYKQRTQKIKGGNMTITCPKCGQQFTDNPTFRIHWQNHSNDSDTEEIRFPCPNGKCNLVFMSLSSLNKHREQVHPENKLLVCTVSGCEIPFSHHMGLRNHLRNAHNVYY